MFQWLKDLWNWGDKPKVADEPPVTPALAWLKAKEVKVVDVPAGTVKKKVEEKKMTSDDSSSPMGTDLLNPLNPLSPLWVGHQMTQSHSYESPAASTPDTSSSSTSDWGSSASDACGGASSGCDSGGGDF